MDKSVFKVYVRKSLTLNPAQKLKSHLIIFRVGTYKSAVEPFLRDDMSPEAKANMQKWLGGMWQNYMQTLMVNRHITANDVLPNAQKYIS